MSKEIIPIERVVQRILVLRQQKVMLDRDSSSNLKFLKQVRAFTEEGIAMLSSVLNTQRAIKVTIAITA